MGKKILVLGGEMGKKILVLGGKLVILWTKGSNMEQRVFKRKIYDRLKEWKLSANGKSALLL